MLTPAELNLLGRLDLAYRRPVSGLYSGERRSPRAARSPEFADFRPYVSGDDFRQIDWRAYARMEKLMLRLYVAEEESALNLVLDTSASMGLGGPAKWPAVRRLAAALAFLGLAAMDRVAVGTLDSRLRRTRHLRGRDGMGRVWAFLEDLQPAGISRPDQLSELDWLRPGMTIVISDFLTEGAWGAPVAGLRRRRQEPLLWQILSPDEEEPNFAGDFKLVDAESGEEREVTVTPSLVADYLDALAEHRSRVRRAAEGAGGRFVNSLSSESLEAQMVAGMTAGVVRR